MNLENSSRLQLHTVITLDFMLPLEVLYDHIIGNKEELNAPKQKWLLLTSYLIIVRKAKNVECLSTFKAAHMESSGGEDGNRSWSTSLKS
ncbi:uncharacterized protein LOC144376279 isoform X2 [Ictidomys tridecemlineatus]